ncbi:MAG: hypothetical protein ACLTSX_13825 [Collinsella sp.]
MTITRARKQQHRAVRQHHHSVRHHDGRREEVEQREREATRCRWARFWPRPAMLPILGIGAIMLASLIALIVAGRRRHEGKDDKNLRCIGDRRQSSD